MQTNANVCNQAREYLIGPEDRILVTGASGFIGPSVVECLLQRGFANVRCLVRPSSQTGRLQQVAARYGIALELVQGNLLSREDCRRVTQGVAVILHLAAGRGEKSYPDAFLNSVVTARNLLEACGGNESLKRFVNVSSFAVYSNSNKPSWRILDERCPLEPQPQHRGEAYCFAKVRQDQLVADSCEKLRIPYVIVRPGAVYGAGNEAISGRVGIGSFGIFLHLGGSNPLPLTYVDNCAEAIALAGVRAGVDGEVFNVVDDDLPTSRKFLRMYKRNVRRFPSVYVPHAVSWTLCYLWEKYSQWSQGQLPPAFNRRRWSSFWKKTYYSNAKLKNRLGWQPKISTAEGLSRYFQACREKAQHA